VTFDPSNGDVHVSTVTGKVVVIIGTTNTVIGAITIGTSPKGLAYDSMNRLMYVAVPGRHAVYGIDGTTNTVVANLSVGPSPQGVTFDTSNGYLYVTDFQSGYVYVVSPASISTTSTTTTTATATTTVTATAPISFTTTSTHHCHYYSGSLCIKLCVRRFGHLDFVHVFVLHYDEPKYTVCDEYSHPNYHY
jgi:sugar lactone lactonase YvrE